MLSSHELSKNALLLEEIERRGGGYVWEAEVFAVHFMDRPIQQNEVTLLTGLAGVREIYIEASEIGYAELRALACIPGIEHLGIARWEPVDKEYEELSACCNGIRLIPDSEL
ncbi:MAG: hypothetical protein IT473_12465 [Lysobacter sp.]|nr:hypothetical protein [Lysobacter sp.]